MGASLPQKDQTPWISTSACVQAHPSQNSGPSYAALSGTMAAGEHNKHEALTSQMHAHVKPAGPSGHHYATMHGSSGMEVVDAVHEGSQNHTGPPQVR